MSSVATIISIAPCNFNEDKASVIPKTYFIPKCEDYQNPTFFHVGDAVSFEYIDETRGNRRYPIGAYDLAKAIVSDIRNSVFGKDAEMRAWPGLAAIEGQISSRTELLKRDAALLPRLIEEQTNWYKFLVKLADDDWQKFKQHKMITSLSVFGAKALVLEREWVVDFNATSTKCPACMSYVDAGASICKHCLTVLNAEKYAMFQKAKAG